MSNNKKVLVINTVSSKIDNGVYCILFNYAKCTCDLYEYDFALAGFAENDAIARLKEIGKDVYIFHKSRVKNPFLYVQWLRKILQKKKYDIVHVHGNSGTMLLEIKTAKQCGVLERICHCHSTSSKFKLAHYIMKTPLNHQLTAAVACSKEAGKWLYTSDFTILNNGIYSEEYVYDERVRREYRRELDLEGSFVIGHVGYMSEEKNQRFIIGIAESLKQKIDNFKVLLVGDGALRSELELEVRSKSLSENVIFLGRRNDVAKLYSAMDAFIFPSKFEGFGLALVEAQASGLRCIASDRVPEATKVDSETRYISLENKEKWIELICSAYMSKEAVKREDASNRSVVVIKKKGFDADSNRQKLINIYEG